MDKDKNLLENEQLFKNLFECSDDKDEKLYKNDLFIPSTEEEEIFKKNTNKNQSEIFRDKILKKLSLEDYIIFPPKNDSMLITDNEVGKDKEDQEKLFEEEIDHLRNLHRLNYLTFSPFGLSFFPNLNSMIDEEHYKYNTHETEEELNEKENKILNIIDFDYNNYEINNDLLFNISMGFVDINKLKHENVVSSENFIPRSERFTNNTQLNNSSIRTKSQHVKKSVDNIYNKNIEFKVDLMNKLVRFVKENENVEFFTSTINNFYKELNIITNLTKNNEKNKLLLKWEKIFIERQKLYQKYLLDLQDKERKKRKKERIRKDMEKKIEEEKMQKIRQEKKFEEELEKIRKKGLKNYEKNRKSFYLGPGEIRREFSIGMRANPGISPCMKSLCSLRANSSCSLNSKREKTRKSQNVSKNNKKNQRKSLNNDNDNDRYGYIKNNNDYFFKLI